ncbi:hypothetical protein O3P69_013876 [Scylla paramamosain]|uniref:Uncharacterized protein n=1 Tax=Scylla paramamosain TaxID=85552 RepID=A0AAW0SR21_SCYPA
MQDPHQETKELPIQRPGSGVILCHLYHQDQDLVCVCCGDTVQHFSLYRAPPSSTREARIRKGSIFK